MGFVENIDQFFDPSDFADEVEYTPQGGEPVCIYGQFQNEFVELDLATPGVGSSQPMIYVKSADVTNAKDGDALNIGGVAYQVAGSPEPDGEGVTLLKLRAT